MEVKVVPDLTFFIQLVNFLVIWMVLNIVLYKPIRGIIKKRGEFMAGQIDAIEKFTTQADTKMKDYEAALDKARRSGVEERNRVKAEALAAEQEKISAAAGEASSKLSAAKSEIESQFKAALASLEKDVQQMAQKATSKILG